MIAALLSIRKLIAVGLAVAFAACDYSIVEVAPAPVVNSGIEVVVVPQSARIAPNDSLALRAIVTGTTDTTVVWTIESGPGSIRSDGWFFAPSVKSQTPTVIRARSTVDTSRSATATITTS